MTTKSNLKQRTTVVKCQHQRTEIEPIKPYGARANVRCLTCNEIVKEDIPNSYSEVMADLSKRKANTHFKIPNTQFDGSFVNFRFDKAGR